MALVTIKKPVKAKKTTDAKPKKPKVWDCAKCSMHQYLKPYSLEASTFTGGLGFAPLGHIAVLLSPMEWENLRLMGWRDHFQAHFAQYSLTFIPYQRCYVTPFDKTTPTLLGNCAHTFIQETVKASGAELVLMSPTTAKICTAMDVQKPKYPGNWGTIFGVPTYLSDNFWDATNRCLDQKVLQKCVTKIGKFFSGTLTWQQPHSFTRVQTLEELQQAEAWIFAQDMVVVDVETTGLDVVSPQFRQRTVCIGFGPTQFCISYDFEATINQDYRSKVLQLICNLYESKRIIKVMHNAKYELKVFMRLLGTDFAINNIEDTQILASIIDAHRPSTSLKYLAGQYFDGYPSTPESFASAAYEELFYYNCLDCYYTSKLIDCVFDQMSIPAYLRQGYNYIYQSVMLPLCIELARLEFTGVQIDYAYLPVYGDTLKTEIAEIETKMLEDYPCMDGKNPSSSKDLTTVLYDILKLPKLKCTEGGAPSTDKNTLQDLATLHGCNLAQMLLDRKSRATKLNTFVQPYIDQRDQYWGDRVRTSYMQIKNNDKLDAQAAGAITGRLSSSGPNLQNTPRDKAVKRMFIATKSATPRVLIQFDLSQAELRIAASVANELVMLDIYNNDGDIHLRTGLGAAPIDVVRGLLALPEADMIKLIKSWRQKAKCINFGLVYHGSASMLMETGKYQYGVVMTRAEAEEQKAAYFRTYPAMEPWHESVIATTKRTGMVISPLGRMRYFPDIFTHRPGSEEYEGAIRASINSPIQGTCADILAEIWCKVAPKVRALDIDAYPVLTVHDSLVWDTEASAVDDLIQLHMSAAAKVTDYHRQTWLKCPMKLDVAFGPNWAELKELGTPPDYKAMITDYIHSLSH